MMKRCHWVLLVNGSLLGLFSSVASAQVSVGSGHKGFDRPGGSVNPKIGGTTARKTKIVKKMSYVAVSPVRDWTSKSGKKIHGTMVAFDAESATKGERKALKDLVLIKDGKVRLLIGKK